ncbi:MAG: ATP-binding protein [Epsilonproteobacteria bacterium]|nr:ATP-binding protein [Campylobacterota bacterium]
MISEEIFEKAGLFYVGRDANFEDFSPTEELTLLKNKNFTTHAAIIGMTGSGKSGLGIDIIEEALIDNIPVIIVDPKGDMGNLLLCDPNFDPNKFKEWVKEEAKAKGEDPLTYATKIAKMWENGIKEWGQSRKRVEKFCNIKKVIYTPGSIAGVPIDLTSTLKAPPKEILEDSDAFATYLSATTSALLALIKLEADLLKSKEAIFISQILSYCWIKGEELSLERLIGYILKPPFKKIGVMALDNFIDEKKRFDLANSFNLILASPAFMGWLKGEELNIQKLLYDENGRAKASIFSISHLDDSQRMFFVTLLLNKIIAWMRNSSGTNTLRMLLYMDEIYGFFPPIKNPPSKEPMLILLKQARAYGIGVVLATQNPVDLDYRGLSNIGSWFIGRLQTKQDIQKVIEGLQSRQDTLSKEELENILTNLKKRLFLLKSAHLDSTRLFFTRWAMSYLKGPLKKDEISKLMENEKKRVLQNITQEKIKNFKESEFIENIILDDSIINRYEIINPAIKEFYPNLTSYIKIYYHDEKKGIDFSKEKALLLDIDILNSCQWDRAEDIEKDYLNFPTKAPKEAKYKPLPQWIMEDKELKECKRELINYIYLNEKLTLYRVRRLKLQSMPNQSYEEFISIVQDRLKELKEEELEEIKTRYEKKEERILNSIQKVKDEIQKEKMDQTTSLISAGLSLIGALFGRKSISKIATAASKGARVLKENSDLNRAQAKLEELEAKLKELEEELEEKIIDLDEKYSIKNYKIEEFFIKPKKSNIEIKDLSIFWRQNI